MSPKIPAAPALDVIAKWQAAIARLEAKLGIAPVARARLGKGL